MEELLDKPISVKFLKLPQIIELQRIIDNLGDILKTKLYHLNDVPESSDDHPDNLRGDNYEVKYDLVIENQRGMKLFGIPLFSQNSLLPVVDPSHFQTINGKNLNLTNNLLANYPLPDLDWHWGWPSWYIVMLNDVDDQGWIYSKFQFNSSHWKGKYYFGNFVRRRIWVRLRTRVKQS